MIQGQPAFERKQNCLVDQRIAKKCILLVDSDEAYCQILGMLLENEGYSVTTCRDTLRAISLIATKPFDFVISEHSNIGVNGVQVLETAKQLNSDIPVLLMAALYEMETYIEAMHRGALDYISKPIDYAEMKRLVCTHS